MVFLPTIGRVIQISLEEGVDRMKKVAAVLAVMVLVVSMVSLVFAAEKKMGTVKAVDAAAGTIVFDAGGSEMTLKVDKDVDLGKIKAGTKAEIMVEGDTVKEIKAKRKAPVGC